MKISALLLLEFVAGCAHAPHDMTSDERFEQEARLRLLCIGGGEGIALIVERD